jgi:hypothetical protein
MARSIVWTGVFPPIGAFWFLVMPDNGSEEKMFLLAENENSLRQKAFLTQLADSSALCEIDQLRAAKDAA